MFTNNHVFPEENKKSFEKTFANYSQEEYKRMLFMILAAKLTDKKTMMKNLGNFLSNQHDQKLDIQIRDKNSKKLHLDDDIIDCVLSSSMPITRSHIIKPECKKENHFVIFLRQRIEEMKNEKV